MSTRRLAAIMFTDIQGYTAQMQQSESEARRLREVHRDIFDRETIAHQGEIIQYYGDGTLSIFHSAVDAVHCAIAMQLAFLEEGSLKVRIGIHSGDIYLTDSDIVGDSVNLASRIESLAIPGSVMISDKVRDEVKNHDSIQTKYIDTFQLKNVSLPVRIYAVSNKGLQVPNRKEIKGKVEQKKSRNWNIPIGISFLAILVVALWVLQGGIQSGADKPEYHSIAVLPFDNFTGSTDLDYFVDGMHASLISDLGKVGALRVISPTTTRKYRNSGKSITEIAQELDVDLVLEASVLCLGDTVCIQPRLISPGNREKQIWVQDYYRDKKQILNLYTRLTKEISSQVNVTLTPEEQELLADTREIDPEAYDLYLIGQHHLSLTSPESLLKARQYFEQALEIEPDWAAPYGGLSSVLAYLKQFGLAEPSEAIPEMDRLLDKALELDPNADETHYQIAVHQVWSKFDWEKGEAEFRKCLELNPNHAMANMFYAHLLTILRRTDEALEYAEKSVRIDPLRPFILGLHEEVLRYAGRCDEAMQQSQKAIAIDPDHFFALGAHGAAAECMEAYETAYQIWRQQRLLIWNKYGVTERIDEAFRDGGWHAYKREEIRVNNELFAAADKLDHVRLGIDYFTVGDYGKALDHWLLSAAVGQNPGLPYLSTLRYYNILGEN